MRYLFRASAVRAVFGSGFRVWRLRVQGLGFAVKGSGFRVCA